MQLERTEEPLKSVDEFYEKVFKKSGRNKCFQKFRFLTFRYGFVAVQLVIFLSKRITRSELIVIRYSEYRNAGVSLNPRLFSRKCMSFEVQVATNLGVVYSGGRTCTGMNIVERKPMNHNTDASVVVT